ncbi:hypothetical protein CO676_08625 [Sinorhizobium sp. BJ1]|jgi:hypothetical protein|nr:hypothetical protein CO676_08625 [Sinorhizobium sp. BJ1]
MSASRTLGAIPATISLHLTGKVLIADQRLAGEFHISQSDRHQVGVRPFAVRGPAATSGLETDIGFQRQETCSLKALESLSYVVA